MKYKDLLIENNIEPDGYFELEQYINYGKWNNHLEEILDNLYNTLSRPSRDMTLYRVLSLSDEKINKLKKGETISIDSRPYSSWTKSKLSISHIINNIHDGKDIIVITKKFKPSEIVVDVDDYYVKNNLTDMTEYDHYVEPEKEVIVKYPLNVITPDMIVNIVENLKTHKWPKNGDYFINSNGNDEEIEFIPSDQPRKERGIFKVFTSYGETAWIKINNDEEWKEIS